MTTAAVLETAEAVCGALHRYDFQHIGDRGASTWFFRGEYPKRIRVEVVRSDLAPYVLVNIEWYNLHRKQRGRVTLQVDTQGAAADVFRATERAVLKCLEIYRDVLAEEGLAGPELAVTESTAAAAVPDTPEDERDAGL